MYKFIPVVFGVIALGVFFALDYRSYSQASSVEVASLDGAHALEMHAADKPEPQGSYFGHLLAKVGLGSDQAWTLDRAKDVRLALRAVPANSYLPTPDEEEEVLMGWERLDWDDYYAAAFGWPDGVTQTPEAGMRKALDQSIAIYVKGRHSVMVQVDFAEPTEALAKRLKQAYWVVQTGRDLERLKEGRPRASYFWTNVKETARGYSILHAQDVAHFDVYDGVHFLQADNSHDRRDVEVKYFFASLGGGLVIKVRALGSDAKVAEILAQIDYQSLNQLQTLPSPLIAEGLAEVLIDTPEDWLSAHGFGAAVHQADAGHGITSAGAEEKSLPKVHRGGIASKNCSSNGHAKHCLVTVPAAEKH
ncbi:hypothetical protein NBRC116601_18850 [Cognatishimia sp. WU-CL00825]|uniref:hypothetical protein n=1 Tax=Cognatishimia sp. WU-CL00825 TaxID=3127658 RepID=UPI0031094BC3